METAEPRDERREEIRAATLAAQLEELGIEPGGACSCTRRFAPPARQRRTSRPIRWRSRLADRRARSAAADTTIHLAELQANVPCRVSRHCTVVRDGRPVRMDYGENDHCAECDAARLSVPRDG